MIRQAEVKGTRQVLFLHGFASSAQSTKARYFRQKFESLPQTECHTIDFNPTPRDFEYVTTTGMVNRLRQYVLDRHLDAFYIIGSSYGGLVAIHYAHRFGGVRRMLLLAPGLRWLSGGLSGEQLEAWRKTGAAPVYHYDFRAEVPVRYDLQADGLRYLTPIPPATDMVIIHGTSDTAVPIDDSRAYAAEHPEAVKLLEVDADHDLNGHLDLAWEYVESFLLGT